MINLDRILGLLLLILAVAYGWGAFNFPAAFAGPESVGPATFPKILAFLIGFCSIYMIVKPDSVEDGLKTKALPELLLVLAVLVLYVFIMEPLGFILSTSLMVAVLCWRMGVKPSHAGITGLCSSTLVFLLFHFGLALPLPIGPWEAVWKL